MRGQVERIALAQANPLTIGEFDFPFAGEQQHPFMVVLVIPEVSGRDMSIGNNALDPHRAIPEQFGNHFLGKVGGKRVKQVVR